MLSHLVGSHLLTIVLVCSGCSVALSPRVETGGHGGDPSREVGGTLPAYPGPSTRPGGSESPMRQICRNGAMPRGWIAVRYAAGDSCPSPVTDDESFNLAVIHRYSDAPLGTTMTVCADQSLPSGWTRERNAAPDAECPGARVQAGAATTYVMRRIR